MPRDGKPAARPRRIVVNAWKSTGRQTTLGDGTRRTVYANAARPGELRIKRMAVRAGKTVATYVKSPPTVVSQRGAGWISDLLSPNPKQAPVPAPVTAGAFKISDDPEMVDKTGLFGYMRFKCNDLNKMLDGIRRRSADVLPSDKTAIKIPGFQFRFEMVQEFYRSCKIVIFQIWTDMADRTDKTVMSRNKLISLLGDDGEAILQRYLLTLGRIGYSEGRWMDPKMIVPIYYGFPFIREISGASMQVFFDESDNTVVFRIVIGSLYGLAPIKILPMVVIAVKRMNFPLKDEVDMNGVLWESISGKRTSVQIGSVVAGENGISVYTPYAPEYLMGEYLNNFGDTQYLGYYKLMPSELEGYTMGLLEHFDIASESYNQRSSGSESNSQLQGGAAKIRAKR